MSAPAGPGIVLQPDEGESYWQPVWANGYSTIKIGPKAGIENLTMGVQVIAPGGYVLAHAAPREPQLQSRQRNGHRRRGAALVRSRNHRLCGAGRAPQDHQ